MYQSCCLAPCCQGKQAELSANYLPNLTVQFVLSPSTVSRVNRIDNGSVAISVAFFHHHHQEQREKKSPPFFEGCVIRARCRECRETGVGSSVFLDFVGVVRILLTLVLQYFSSIQLVVTLLLI